MEEAEKDANRSIRAALEAVQAAARQSAVAGYGSEVRGALEEASRALGYAVRLVEGGPLDGST